jgi:hypothetical protein
MSKIFKGLWLGYFCEKVRKLKAEIGKGRNSEISLKFWNEESSGGYFAHQTVK